MRLRAMNEGRRSIMYVCVFAANEEAATKWWFY